MSQDFREAGASDESASIVPLSDPWECKVCLLVSGRIVFHTLACPPLSRRISGAICHESTTQKKQGERRRRRVSDRLSSALAQRTLQISKDSDTQMGTDSRCHPVTSSSFYPSIIHLSVCLSVCLYGNTWKTTVSNEKVLQTRFFYTLPVALRRISVEVKW